MFSNVEGSNSPETVIELSEVSPSTNHSQNKVNVSNIDFALEYKTSKNGRHTSNQHESLCKKLKVTSCEFHETLERTNLISPYTSRRLSRVLPGALEDQAEEIVKKIGNKNKLTQRDPVSKFLMLEIIRSMPHSLALKRAVKAKLSTPIQKKSKLKSIGCLTKLKYRLSMSISKTKQALYQIGSSINQNIWHNSLQIIQGHFGSGIAIYFKLLRWLFIINLFVCFFSISFVTLPQALIQLYKTDAIFSVKDLFLGNGFFTNSIIYYGFYTDKTVYIDFITSYDMPMAYFATFFFCYAFTFILLFCKVTKSYRKCFIETSSSRFCVYAHKIFCNWDWGVSSQKSMDLRSASIYRELQELLSETKNFTDSASFGMKFWTLLIRVAMTTLIFTIMCGTIGLLWLLLSENQIKSANDWTELKVPLTIIVINNLFPPLLSWSVKYERYSKDRIAFYVTMLRAFAIAVVAMTTLLVFWLTHSMGTGCWQTRLAQEGYRLIIFDFFASLIVTFVIQATRSALRRYLGPPKFDIACCTLGLIYNQSLFWAVHYFSPPLSLIVVVKLYLMFYVKKFELLKLCEPPSRYWFAAQTETLFLVLALFGLLGTFTMLSYVVVDVDTSACGPFIGKNHTWELVIDNMLRVNRDGALWSTLKEIANPATSFALLFVIGLAAYYLKARAESSKQTVEVLRNMLLLQARDKEFLQRMLSPNYGTTSRHRPCLKVDKYNDITNSTQDRQPLNEPSTSY